ncbi:HET-domain-containing protein [Zopfia rhizophila CBS 207.26]|uniref:HET-domain-containing protein n=1 Tax=Zopfia rhizophila CBS 207.26 TaxID=1314779 RepID=A0A6A6DUQ8_9PEZI|nr:HET-domain-containing protein [Zopfia rhizophila CBS 207.26]
MSLCSACKIISVSALICELQDVPGWWDQLSSQSKPRGMVHLQDARQLPLSAAGCPLCTIIKNAILQHNSNQPFTPNSVHQHTKSHTQERWNLDDFEEHLINKPIYLRPKQDPLKRAFPHDHVANASHIRGFLVFVPVDHGILTGQIRLLAPQDSPAAVSCDVIGRPILPSSDSPEAYDLIHRWVRTCIVQHEACRKTFSGAVIDESSPPILPSRIIDVGFPDGEVAPRLIETKGMTGIYVALSHCWGPAHKRPLMTTQSTLQDHLAGIPWDTIPKTYQDAITVTRRIGIQYIWIDSLCIIQDSHSDWLHESKLMGAVYEYARLTLAASHASDSSQGCFLARPQPPSAIELPHISQTGEHGGPIFAESMPTDYTLISPEFGPLASRAWATQEWLLSRRMIFYTAESLVWSCKVITQRETGGSFHSTGRNHRWKIIIERYSARLLTNAGDRLMALEGLRTEMGKRRGNDVYCYGLWKNSMPDQLLWYCIQPAERAKSPLGLPSWSWASTVHGVRFLDIKKAKNATEGIQFNEAKGNLIIRSRLNKAPKIIFPYMIQSSDGTPLISSNVVGGVQSGLPSAMTCAVCAEEDAVLGWGVLDEGQVQHCHDIFCVLLMSKRVLIRQPPVSRISYQEELVLLLQKSDDSADTSIHLPLFAPSLSLTEPSKVAIAVSFSISDWSSALSRGLTPCG